MTENLSYGGATVLIIFHQQEPLKLFGFEIFTDEPDSLLFIFTRRYLIFDTLMTRNLILSQYAQYSFMVIDLPYLRYGVNFRGGMRPFDFLGGGLSP